MENEVNQFLGTEPVGRLMRLRESEPGHAAERKGNDQRR